MANTIVEYMRHKTRGLGGSIIPPWIIDTVNTAADETWCDPDNFTYVGVVLPLADRGYLIPDAVVTLTAAELGLRVADIHTRYPFKNSDGSVMTPAQLEATVAAWVAAATTI